MKPYGLVADLHLHNWQSFSKSLADGRNDRLVALHDEINRCAHEVFKAGGNIIYIAGDVFHVRGSIAPSVLNPTLDVTRNLIGLGIEFRIIPGNHDLEGKHSTRLGSAVTALESVGCTVCDRKSTFVIPNEQDVVCFPWHDNVGELKAQMTNSANELGSSARQFDAIIHAPVDGTLVGIPAHGISPEYLASLGFKRVFAGHYHHHKDFGNGVYSIGALSHHTWSDVGTKAGFLIVSESEVKWFKAHTPEFVDLSAAENDTEAEILAEGNFVRARMGAGDPKAVAAMREWMEKSGAAGIVIQVIKDAVKTREGGVAHTVKAGASIEASIAAYIESIKFPNAARLQLECQKIMAEVEAA